MLNHMGQSFQGAKYDNRYMFKISIIECIHGVGTATCYVLCIRSTYTAISVGKQTRACCPTCMRNADCPVTGTFKSAQERATVFCITSMENQDQYLALLKVWCILWAVQSLGSTFHSLTHTSRTVPHRAMVCWITPSTLVQLDNLKYIANMQHYYLHLKANTFFPLSP